MFIKTTTLTPTILFAEQEAEYIPDGMSKSGQLSKRVFDFIVSAFCLVVFSPLMLLCYLLVKREDGGPAIFKQERIGMNGEPFYIYKFRSMKMDAEKHGPQLTNHDGDHRMTKIGRSTTATPTRWRRCCVVWSSTSTIWSTAHGFSTARSWQRPSSALLSERSSNCYKVLAERELVRVSHNKTVPL